MPLWQIQKIKNKKQKQNKTKKTKTKKQQTNKKQISDFNNYKQIRNEVTFQIRKAKNEEIDKLKNKLTDPNICQKD